MTIVGALLATKFTSNSTIENFKDTMVLDNSKQVSKIDYNSMVTNSSVNFILICVIILINIIPALLIAYHCSKTLTEKILVNNNYKDISFDVGFLVYNNKNYPLFNKLLKLLEVKSINSSMSFSVSNKINNFEYGSTGFFALTDNFRNIFKVKFWILLKEISRFYKVAHKVLNFNKADYNKSVDAFLKMYKNSVKINPQKIFQNL